MPSWPPLNLLSYLLTVQELNYPKLLHLSVLSFLMILADTDVYSIQYLTTI